MEPVRTEILYTYEAAIKEFERRRHHEWLCRQEKLKEIREEQKARREYFCQQKFYGLLMIVIVGIVTVLVWNPICTIFMIPGLYMMITKKMVLVNDYYWTHGGNEQWKDIFGEDL